MDTMKDSGIKWIGKVPSSWKLIRMKDCSYMKGRIGWQGLTADEFTEKGPYLVTGTDFDNGHVCWDRSYHVSEKRYEEAPEIQLKDGDLLVTKDGTIGKIAFIDDLPGKACLNSHLLVIRPLYDQYINRYLYWILSSPVFQGYYEQMSYGSTMNSLSQENIGNFHVFVPSVEEQGWIAHYLDKHCAKIDRIIKNLEIQISSLNQLIKSLIYESVRTKQPGWTYGRIKNLMSLQRGYDLPQDDFIYGDYPVYGSNGIIGYHNRFTTTAPGIVIGRSGSVGELNYVTEKFWAHNTSIFVKDNKGNNMRYLYYVLSSIDIKSLASGSAVPTLDRKNIENVHLWFTLNKNEQIEIAQRLDKKIEAIQRVLYSKNKQLDIIRKHKNALIYECVTGKKRVKEVANYADQS